MISNEHLTINNICHAIKIIIRLTETLHTSLLTLPNSIYIMVNLRRTPGTLIRIGQVTKDGSQD